MGSLVLEVYAQSQLAARQKEHGGKGLSEETCSGHGVQEAQRRKEESGRGVDPARSHP